MRRCVVAWGTVLLFWGSFLGTTARADLSDEACQVCHGDPSASAKKPDGRVVSLYVDGGVFAKTVHGPMGCVGCHSDIEEVPHADSLKPVDCTQCHEQAKEYADSLHGKALQDGDQDIGGCLDCHGKHDIRSKTDPLSPTHRMNLAATCGRCHSDATLTKRHMVSVFDPSRAYLHSVHGRIMQRGDPKAAVCTDCHGTHQILPTQDPRSAVNRANVPATCGKCHDKPAREFEDSIHGKALRKGVKDAPNCADCHGEHNIDSPAAATSQVSARAVSRETCPKCHNDEKVMKRYGIATRRQGSYMDSYHGLSTSSSSLIVASCTSCHGVHDILPSSDARASTHKANLPQTCGKCHKDAGPNFAQGAVHIIPASPSQKAAGIVRLIYLWLIGLILGGMLAHNIILFLRSVIAHCMTEARNPDSRQRFTIGQRAGHVVLAGSFIALAISGFALRYPDSWMTLHLFGKDAGLAARGLIHRGTAIVFVALMLVHFLHALLSRYGRRELFAMILVPRDLRDLFHNLGYGLGLASRPPRFDRYSYREKFEYWGLIWGSVIMIVTGFAMWYADLFLRYFPKVVLDVASLIHFYEAILATGSILIWHFYMVIFDPDAYPMNGAWLTGRISNEEFRDRHPLEYERVHGKAAETKNDASSGDCMGDSK